MKWKRIAALLAAGCMLCLAGCGGNGTLGSGASGLAAQPDAAAEAAVADFSFRLLQTTAEQQTEAGNLALAPFSMETALAAAGAGASEQTRADLEAVLCEGADAALFRGQLAAMRSVFAEGDSPYRTAFSVWVRDDGDAALDETFAADCASLFDAAIRQLPFDDAALSEINGWASRSTDGKIPELLTSIDAGAELYLLDAACFSAAWEEPVASYAVDPNGTFHAADGASEPAVMLSLAEPHYLEVGAGAGFAKPYAGGRFSFFALLPPEGTDPAAYLRTFSGADFLAAFRDTPARTQVLAELPEFRAECAVPMNETLQALGLQSAFSPDAGFDAILRGDRRLVLTQALQKTVFSLDRSGTEAGAVSALEMSDVAGRAEQVTVVKLRFDRPFVFGIADTASGVPIFAGILSTTQQP